MHTPPLDIGDIHTITSTIFILGGETGYVTDRDNVLHPDEIELVEDIPELKSGMVIETKDGRFWLLMDTLDDGLIAKSYSGGCFMSDVKYCNDNCKSLDIVKIYKPKYNHTLFNVDKLIHTSYILWERKEEILDAKEKEYLSNVIRPFRDDVLTISKINYSINIEYISIRVKSKMGHDEVDNINLPCFKKDTMYKGMKHNKQYPLKELGL